MEDTSILPNIEPIKIMMDTNIPGKEPFAFTSSMLYHPSIKEQGKLSEYPLITLDRDYKKGVVDYLNRLTYEKKVKFFFNKDNHLRLLSTVGLYTPNKPMKLEKQDPKERDARENIKKMKKELEEEQDNLIREINDTREKKLKELQSQLQEISKTKNKIEIDKKNKEIKKYKFFYKYLLKCVKKANIGALNNKYYVYDNTPDSDPELSDDQDIFDFIKDELVETNMKTKIEYHFKAQYLSGGKVKYPNPVKQLRQISEEEQEEQKKTPKKVINPFQYGNSNIMLMLIILFPNRFPLINNITESFESMINKKTYQISIKDAINIYAEPTLYPHSLYSYLKIDGKTYTTTQLIWLNDVYNHPTYSRLIRNYNLFKIQKEKSKDKLFGELEKKRKKFKQDFESGGKYAIDEKIQNFLRKQKKEEIQTVFGENKIRELNSNIESIIENIDELNLYLDFNPPKYKLILDTTNAIRQRYKRIESEIVKTKDIDMKLSKLIKSIDEINVYEVIFTKYLDTDEIMMNDESEEEKVKSELKSKYTFYMTFIDSLKEFIRPKKESSNLKLQESLEDFANGVNQDNFLLLMKPKELIDAGDVEIAKTDASILPSTTPTDPRLEIYIQLNVIEGELNNTNKSKVNCIYKGEYLGTMLDQLLYPQKMSWELNKKRLFFNINDKEVQKEIKEKEVILPPPSTAPVAADKKGKNQTAQPVPLLPTQGGGRTKKYRLLPIYKLRSSNRRTKRK